MKYFFFGLMLLFCCPLYGQQNKIDSLISLLKKDKADTNKIIHLNALVLEYKDIGNYDTCLYYANNAIELANVILSETKNTLVKQTAQKGIAASYNSIAIVYMNQGDYPNASDYYLKALKIFEELGNKNKIATVLGNIGNVYRNKGDYPKALYYYFRALKMKEDDGDKNGIARQFGSIGNLYREQGNYPKSLEYSFKALKIFEEIGDKKNLSTLLGNIGIVYSVKADIAGSDKVGSDSLYEKALDYFFKALKIAEEIGNKNGIAQHLTNIGTVYQSKGDYPKALEYGFMALKTAEEIGSKKIIAGNIGNIGNTYISLHKYNDAYNYLYSALALSDSIGGIDYVKSFYQALSTLYEKSNIPLRDSIDGKLLDMEQMRLRALYYHKRYISIRDTLFNEENKKQLVRKEMNYEFDKKEAILKEQQEKERAVAEEKNRKQKIITWSVISGLLLVLVFAGFIFRSLRVTRKQKEIIEIKSKETEQQKHIIEEKNKDITDSINYAKRIQRAMLPHRKDIWTAFPQSFVLFKPKDIVSGDFYFFHKNSHSAFIAAADCTGHGVPGAFMSMIGSEKLNDAVPTSSDVSEILSLLNKGVKTALKQSEDDEKSTRDGMDIALCSVDTVNRIVKYAGANRPIWIIRKGATEVEQIKATKKAIGGFTEDNQHFDSHEIKLMEGDTFYLSTDGYGDTFGKGGKKIMTKKFKEILISIQDKPMKEQEKQLDEFVENWKAGTEQVDDILVIGVRL